jgi:hypothetical protein
MAAAENSLVAAMIADAREAWRRLHEKFPGETFYAFGFYTTELGSYFGPFACGEEGLEKVAAEYVARRTYRDLERAKSALRWSIADSPYRKEVTALDAHTAGELAKRPEPDQLDDVPMAREVRARMNAAVAALNALDEEGLFGTGKARAQLTLLIEAGDREEDFVLKWAKKLNPPAVYEAFAKIGARRTVGTFTEFGTKKVYTTERLAVSADRRLVATAGWYYAFLFDVVAMKQHFCRSIVNARDKGWICDTAMSSDGTTVAFLRAEENRGSYLAIFRGAGWKEQTNVRVGTKPFALACAPDGSWFAVSDTGRVTTVFNASGERIASLAGHKASVLRLATSPDGALLASIGPQAGLLLWNTRDWSLQRRIAVSGDGVTFDATGRYLLTTPRRQAHGLAIWDVASGELVRELTVPGYRFTAARFSPDGRTIAAAVMPIVRRFDEDYDEAVLLDANDGRVLERLRGGFEAITDFVFLPEKNAIAFAAYGHTLRPLTLWEINSM